MVQLLVDILLQFGLHSSKKDVHKSSYKHLTNFLQVNKTFPINFLLPISCEILMNSLHFLTKFSQSSFKLLTKFLRSSYNLHTKFLQTSYKLLTKFLQSSYKPLSNFLQSSYNLFTKFFQAYYKVLQIS
jgi:hypothetical protein